MYPKRNEDMYLPKAYSAVFIKTLFIVASS